MFRKLAFSFNESVMVIGLASYIFIVVEGSIKYAVKQ